VCSASEGLCEQDVYCTGSSADCPDEQLYEPSSTICRAVTDSYSDKAEYCTGYSADCPPDLDKKDGDEWFVVARTNLIFLSLFLFLFL
jgi:hypothetical protein